MLLNWQAVEGLKEESVIIYQPPFNKARENYNSLAIGDGWITYLRSTVAVYFKIDSEMKYNEC